MLTVVPLVLRDLEPPPQGDVAADARRLEQRLRDRAADARDVEVLRLVAIALVALGALELLTWLLGTPLGWAPKLGTLLDRYGSDLRREGPVDVLLGAVWGLYAWLLATSFGSMLAKRIRYALPVLLGALTFSVEQLTGGLTARRLGTIATTGGIALLIILVIGLFWAILVIINRRDRSLGY
jgi:hypothetical protein